MFVENQSFELFPPDDLAEFLLRFDQTFYDEK